MLSAVLFKKRDTTSEDSRRDWEWKEWRVRRTPFYLIGLALLFIATLFILIALFTNNWIKTASYLVNNMYYTFGLWFVCWRYNNNANLYQYNSYGYNGFKGYPSNICETLDYSTVSYIYAVQVFYVIAAIVNFVDLGLAIVGLCLDVAVNRLFAPSFLLWSLLVSVLFQIIAVAVYGGAGVGNYSQFEPDYSMILACFALGIDFIAAVLFGIECVFFRRRHVAEQAARQAASSS